MSAVSVSFPIPASNGRVPHAAAREPYGASRSRSHARLTWLAVAAAIVLLMAGFGGYFVYDRFGPANDVPAVIPAPQLTPEGNWPMDRGNPAHTGVSDGFGPVADPDPLWKFDTGGAASRSPIMVDGVVYGGSENGSLYALDATTGAELWRFQADMAIDMTPAYFDGMVYVPTQTGTLYAVDAKTGTERWHLDQGISFWSAPTFANGLVFAGSHDGLLYAIAAESGRVSWSLKTSGSISQAPAVSDGVLYAGSDDGYLYAVKASDGTQLWRTFIKTGIFGAPSVADGTAYLTISNGLSTPGSDLYAIDISNGAERYHREFAETTSAVTVSDGVLYLGEQGDGIHALAAADGSDVWTFEIGGGGRIVKNTGDGFLAEFSSAVGAVRAAVQFQARIKELTIGEVEERRIAFRVGVNIGDVIVEPHDIFGDGVNIAARLESIAEPGGVCISSAAYDQVQGKVGVEFADFGEQDLKNIARPVRAYAVVRAGSGPVIQSGRARPTPFSPPPFSIVGAGRRSRSSIQVPHRPPPSRSSSRHFQHRSLTPVQKCGELVPSIRT